MSYVRELRSLVGHRPLIVVGAAVIILDEENRLLLCSRRDNQSWGLIGGSMEISESLEETAKREVLEETGLTLDELNWFDLFSGQELIYELPHGDVVINVVAAYVSRKYIGQPEPDNTECSELRFFKLSELPKNISPPDKPVIAKFLSSLTTEQL